MNAMRVLIVFSTVGGAATALAVLQWVGLSSVPYLLYAGAAVGAIIGYGAARQTARPKL